MKNNLGIIILIALLVVVGCLSQSKPVNLGGYGSQSVYLIVSPTQGTSTINVEKSNGNPTTLVSENTGRVNFVIKPPIDMFIWLSNTTSTAMTNNAVNNSDGILIASGVEWNMKDYGIIWPGIIYGMASSTTSTVQYIDYTGN